MPKSSIISIVVLIVVSAFPKCDGWHYKIVSFNTTSSDESVFAVDLKPVLVAPDLYGLDGVVELGSDVTNDYTIEAQLFRSAPEPISYKPTLLRIPKCSLRFFMNTIYKNVVMNDISKCSNLPVFQGQFRSVITAGTYRLNSCALAETGLPKQMREGFYKAVVTVKGPQVKVICELVAQLYT